ncbi:hypothetical protein RRG08_050650 [Elysia crispata]|uniref:Uncharacterized protein n=1 Tax=Elysia crispata TaxID=231223 RepID=A0AAE1AGB4_9GAST|nr:hypothetical protein RRG08_050650 [Elysia crispata]
MKNSTILRKTCGELKFCDGIAGNIQFYSCVEAKPRSERGINDSHTTASLTGQRSAVIGQGWCDDLMISGPVLCQFVQSFRGDFDGSTNVVEKPQKRHRDTSKLVRAQVE